MASYTSPSISGYNSNPPSDDGTESTANRVDWDTIKTKLDDPIKSYAEAIDSATTTAFSTYDASAKYAFLSKIGTINFALSGLTRYSHVIGSAATSATLTAMELIVPSAGTIKNLYCKGSANDLDADVVFTIMKDGAAQTLTATIAAGSAAITSDTSSSFTVVAGSRLTIRWAVATASTGDLSNTMVSFVLV